MYETLARYYDQIHASLTADLPYVLKLAEEQGGPLLELGSGTGRLLFPLAEAGFQVTGIDNSPQMLRIARQRLAKMPPAVRQAATLLEEDMLDLTQETTTTRFALALLSYNTLLHFPEADAGRLLRGAARLLQPGGLLFIDMANPFLITAADYAGDPVLETSFIDEVSGERVEQWSRSSLDTQTQTLTVSWLFRPHDDQSETQAVKIEYHYLYPHQVILLLQQAGFSPQKVLGSYTGAPFAEDSERLLLLARAPEQPSPAH